MFFFRLACFPKPFLVYSSRGGLVGDTRVVVFTRRGGGVLACVCPSIVPVQHRDLKLDNILTDETKEGADVKLVDFGLSAHFKDFQLEHDVVGTWVSWLPLFPIGALTMGISRVDGGCGLFPNRIMGRPMATMIPRVNCERVKKKCAIPPSSYLPHRGYPAKNGCDETRFPAELLLGKLSEIASIFKRMICDGFPPPEPSTSSRNTCQSFWF